MNKEFVKFDKVDKSYDGGNPPEMSLHDGV